MGKNKYIKSPEEMYELFEGYKAEVKGNPKVEHQFVGRDARPDYRQIERPLTLVGFYNYARRNKCNVHQYFEDTGEAYKDYLGICRAIKDEIREDQIEGGMAGIYNPSITQRLNNLTEKAQYEHKVDQTKLPDWLKD